MTISLTFPDGAKREFPSGISGVEIAKGISPSLLKRTVAMALDGTVVDLADPIERDAKIEFLNREDPRSLELIPVTSQSLQYTVKDKRGKKDVLASAIHRELGRKFGFTKFKSSDFEVSKKRRRFNFEGRGMGHGVGLCQYGAEARAQAGQSAEEILRAYFPKLELAHLAEIRPQQK